MQINRSLPLLALLAFLSGCAGPAIPPPRPAPTPSPTYVPPPPPPPPLAPPPRASAPKDWRDAPQTAGDWSYRADPTGSAAQFGPAAGEVLLTLRCDRTRNVVTLARTGLAQAPVPMTVLTTQDMRPLSADPVAISPAGAGGKPPTVAVNFTPRDSLLDSIAFSRGRFAVEVSGLPTLYLPAWAELGRVIEDCR